MSGNHALDSLASLASGMMEVGAEKCIAEFLSGARIPLFCAEIGEEFAPL